MKQRFILTSILVLALLEVNKVTCDGSVTVDPAATGGPVSQQVTQAAAPHAPLQAAAAGTDAAPSTSALTTGEHVTTVPPTTTTPAPSFDETEEKKFCGHINYTEITSPTNYYTNEYDEKKNKTLPLEDGWYHFADQQGVSVEIPRNCIKVGYCGTKNPVTVGLDDNTCLPQDNGGELSAQLCVGEMLGSVDMCCARPVGSITIRRCSNRRFLYNVTLNRGLVSKMDDFGICMKKIDEKIPTSYLFREPDSPKPETDHKKGIPIKEDTDKKREGSVVTVYIKRPTQQNTLTECDRWRWFKQFDSPFRERLASELTKQNRTSVRQAVTTPPPTQEKELDVDEMEGAEAILSERDHIPDIDPEGVGKPPFPFNLRKKRRRRSSDVSSSQSEASKPIVYTKDDIEYTTVPVFDGDNVIVTVVAAKKGDEVPSDETVLAAENLREDSSNETIVGVPVLDAHEGYSDRRSSGDWDSSVWRRHRTLFIVLIVLIVLAVLILLLLLLVCLLLRRRASHRHQSYAVSEEKHPIRADDPKSEAHAGITNPAAELTPVEEKPHTSLGEPSTFTSPPPAPQSQSPPRQEPPARQQPVQQQQASPPPPPPASSSPNDKTPHKLFGLRLPWSHGDKNQANGGQPESKKPTSPPPPAPLAVAYDDNNQKPAGDSSTLPADHQLKPPTKNEKAPSPTNKKQSSLVLPWDNWKLGGGDGDKKNKDKDNGWIVPLEDMPKQSPPPSPQPPPPQLPPPPPPEPAVV